MGNEVRLHRNRGIGVAEQRADALAKANIRRKQLKELRAALKAREVDAITLIQGHPNPAIEEVVARIRLITFLPMIPGVGKPRAMEIIAAFEESPRTRLGDLPPSRRRDLAYITRGALDRAYVV